MGRKAHKVAVIILLSDVFFMVCFQVKDSPPFLAVASNTSGSTPKDLFEDVAEELLKQVNL